MSKDYSKGNWRDDPITDRQISLLKRLDDYFTFDRLSGLTKGEASDYIKEYTNKKGKIDSKKINFRSGGVNSSREISREIEVLEGKRVEGEKISVKESKLNEKSKNKWGLSVFRKEV